MFKAKMAIHSKRRQAKISFDCLTSWMRAGRYFAAIKAYAKRVRYLQRWWRKQRLELREIRDQVARRWAQLERNDLIANMPPSKLEAPAESQEKAPQQPTRTEPGTKKALEGPSRLVRIKSIQEREERKMSKRLVVEDSVSKDMIDECVRLCFIENELRVLRYKLLPQIHIWEVEERKWQESTKEFMALRTAGVFKSAQRMNPYEDPLAGRTEAQTGTDGPVFHWPPSRPSYVPHPHPAFEMNLGCECPKDCLGRRGDEEIMAMIRTCRKNPEGYRTIEQKPPRQASLMPRGALLLRGKSPVGASGKISRMLHTEHESAPQDPNLYNHAPTDEDLRCWAAHMEAMPGLCSGTGAADATTAVM